ncbi:MAG TPA: hypothetical protein VHX39_21440 [Acetobacteraceae bacterium]|nr:hypothetical protein [Acetobacteraceae bacterium]
MNHLLAGSQIKLTYLQDRRALSAIDWPSIFDDLTNAGLPVSRIQWCDLGALTHVVLAVDRNDSRHAGVLGLVERTSPVKPWLMIELALVRPDETKGMLRRSMLAHALARVVCLDGIPLAMAAAHNGRATLNELSRDIRLASLHPPADGNVIELQAAGLARQIGNDRSVLDLRSVSEGSLLRDLRGLHGIRAMGKKATLSDLSMARMARNAAATRRPRKATHTGRIG